MAGIIITLLLSWWILRWFAGKNLEVLGFYPTQKRSITLVAGLLLAAFTCTAYHFMDTAFAANSWTVNKAFTVQTARTSTGWTIKSVLFEELVFRGALLYIGINKLGVKKACILSAVCFGVYHWFSFGAFGNPILMIIIFIMTGFFGFVLAYAYARTGSLYLPIGIHLGWNLCHIVVFSNGPLGAQLLIKVDDARPEGIVSLLVFLFQLFALPLLTLGYVNRLAKKSPVPVTGTGDSN